MIRWKWWKSMSLRHAWLSLLLLYCSIMLRLFNYQKLEATPSMIHSLKTSGKSSVSSGHFPLIWKFSITPVKAPYVSHHQRCFTPTAPWHPSLLLLTGLLLISCCLLLMKIDLFFPRGPRHVIGLMAAILPALHTMRFSQIWYSSGRMNWDEMRWRVRTACRSRSI